MKRILYITLTILTAVSCSRYDDTAIWDELRSHEERIAALEKWCEKANTNIAALEAIINALQQNDYVTGVTSILENGEEVGYTITFSKSEPVNIYHGKDGADGQPGAPGQDGKPGQDGQDGHTPVIGVKEDADGVYYWTLDGEWILDEDGNKIPADGKDGEDGEDGADGQPGAPGQDGEDGQPGAPGEDGKDGKDGIAPQIKIENDCGWISYEEGQTWTQLYKAVGEDGKDGEDGKPGKDGEDGDSFFKSVDTSDPNYVIITFADGTQIKLPTWKAFEDLQAQVEALNKGVEALQAMVEALNSKTYVTGVTPIVENGKEIGYTINFSDGQSVAIYHGKDGQDGAPGKDGQDGEDGQDGKDGYSPVIGAKQDTDGKYYWTLDGEWMTDENGNKIPTTGADGKDGIAPVLKIEDNMWYVSYDGGKTWEKEPLGPAVSNNGESFFSDVKFDAEFIYITLADGEEIKLPRHNEDSQKVPCTIELVKVEGQTATFTGHIDVAAEDLTYTQVTIYYSDAETFNIYNAKSVSTSAFDKDQNFTIELRDLRFGSTYNYCVYVKVKSEKMYGSVLQFDVHHPYYVEADLNAASATDLSAAESANSYIVSKSGLYKFKAVKGNSNETVGNVASAIIVWESFGTEVAPELFSLIEGVCCSNDYIVFKTSGNFAEGNALIAARDKDGEILWSWHIWFTDAPAGQVYNNEAGTMMDRNLGATSPTPGEAGALGLFYQWGRKDPFLGSSSVSTSTLAKSTIAWPDPVISDSFTGSPEYATAHPTTFIENNTVNKDWYFTDSPSVDNTRWLPSSSPKTVYDPCPAGWRVPDGGTSGVWAKALNTEVTSTFDSDNKGINLTGTFGEDAIIWYPSAGSRHYTEGTLTTVGSSGIYWSATPYTSSSVYASVLCISSNGRVNTNDYGNRARGYSVRCIME